LDKYCKFLPVEIVFEDKTINDPTPLWTKKPSELKEEDYMEFYRKLYPAQEDPLFYIHLNVDYPFTLTGVLYFPKIKDNVEISRNKIQLYCNQVFVTDSVENIVPDFLTLLHGVIDSPDIPLNVSRSYLQSDSNVKKISSHITKKVADRLEELFKNERNKLEEKWDNLKLFIEYGMLSDEKFFERAEKFALLKNTDNKYFSFEEYKQLIESNQTDKNKKLVYLYANDSQKQYTYIESAKSKGYDVLLLDNQLDSHFVNLLESKFNDSSFARVDSDHIDKLILKEEIKTPDLPSQELNDLSTAFESVLPQGPHYNVTVENLGEKENAVLITQSEFMRRYRDMSALGGGMNFYGSLPESFNITVNHDHPVIQKIFEQKISTMQGILDQISLQAESVKQKLDSIKEKIGDKKEEEIETSLKDEKSAAEKEMENINQERNSKMKEFAQNNQLIRQVCDLALLSNGMLKGEELDKFVKRSLSLIK
jgi:molecular chaperone HtpG